VNQVPAPPVRFFSSGAALQEVILQEVEPGALVIVPHRRLARQVWHKQRLANLERGAAAWEPLPLMTLPDWWAELYRNLWPPYALAPPLVRLALWRRAIAAAPPLEGTSPDLEWAQALDEAHDCSCAMPCPWTGRVRGNRPWCAGDAPSPGSMGSCSGKRDGWLPERRRLPSGGPGRKGPPSARQLVVVGFNPGPGGGKLA
jgi:hypothetical protein